MKLMEQLSSLLGDSRPGDCQCTEMINCVFVSLEPENQNTAEFIEDLCYISMSCVYIAYYVINLENYSSNKPREPAHLHLISFNYHQESSKCVPEVTPTRLKGMVRDAEPMMALLMLEVLTHPCCHLRTELRVGRGRQRKPIRLRSSER